MTNPTDKPDIPDDDGARPPFARVSESPPLGEIGTGAGYSGQEYDSEDQVRWRAEQDRLAVPKDGVARGSGAGAGGGNPGEDFDSDAAGGDGNEATDKPS